MTRILAPAALCAAVVAAYSPSLRGGFLEWDDGWLVRDNPWMRAPASRALPAFVTRLDPGTRIALGAEYLPVRDAVTWAEVRAFGASPRALRAMALLWYLAGVLLLRAYLRRALPDGRAAEAIVWLFALHPLHVEEAAWIASHKDLLAFGFVAAALLVHAGEGRARAWAVPLLLALAHFSKGPSVVAVGLLAAHDLYRGRRFEPRVYAPAIAVALAATWMHVRVGQSVGMQAEFGAGGRAGVAATMGAVWLRDLARLVCPTSLSALYHVPDRTFADPLAWAGWAAVAALAATVALAWRRGHTLPLLAFAWLVVPRLPTSQVLVPLQNRMADRYLFWCVLAPALLAGAAAARWRAGRWLAAGLALTFAMLTVERSAAFASNIALWDDTSAKLVGEIERATGTPPVAARAALGNLATALVGAGRLREAEAVYRAVVARWPDDPKAWNNLAEIVGRMGRAAESRALFLETMRRFPKYELARKNYRLHFGEPPGPVIPP